MSVLNRTDIRNNRIAVLFIEIFLSISPALFYLNLNKSLRTNFPEETFLLNSWNLFSTLLPFGSNPLNYQRSLTSFAAIPEFIFAPFFDSEKPFQLLTFTVIFRLLILFTLSYILFRIITTSVFFRIVIFNFTFFNITVIWSLLVSPRFYSLVLLYILLIMLFKVQEFKRINIFALGLLTGVLTFANLANVANLIATFIIFTVLIGLLVSFDKSIISKIKNINLYYFIFSILSIYLIGIVYVAFTSKFISELRANHDFGFIPLSGNPLLALIGSGHWSEFAGSEGIPYCSFCPLQNEFLIFRISIVIALIFFSLFTIASKFDYKAMIVSAGILILIPVVSALGRSDKIFSFFVNEYTIVRIFREPWSKFSYFIPLIIGLILAFVQTRYKQLSKKQLNILFIGLPFLIFINYLFIVNYGYVIPIDYKYSVFIWICLSLFFWLFRNIQVIIASLPFLFLVGTFSSLSSISENEQLKLDLKSEYSQTVQAFVFFKKMYTDAELTDNKKCFIISSYNRESMINFFASSISPIPSSLLLDSQNSARIVVERDTNNCLKESIKYDQIYFPTIFAENSFFDSSFFEKYCEPISVLKKNYFTELNCNKVNLYDFENSDLQTVSFTDPNNQGIGQVASDIVLINSSHATIFLNPELKIRSWKADINFNVKANPDILQLGEINVDIYIENLRLGTISVSDEFTPIQLELPFGSFSDGTIQKIDFISALNPNQQRLLDEIKLKSEGKVGLVESRLYLLALNTIVVDD